MWAAGDHLRALILLSIKIIKWSISKDSHPLPRHFSGPGRCWLAEICLWREIPEFYGLSAETRKEAGRRVGLPSEDGVAQPEAPWGACRWDWSLCFPPGDTDIRKDTWEQTQSHDTGHA